MRLDDLDPSSNVSDLGSGGGGGGGGIPILGLLLPFLFRGGMGCGGLVLLLIAGAAFLLFGGLGSLGGGGGGLQTGQQRDLPQGAAACNTAERLFACRVLTSTEQVWSRIFAANGQRYEVPRLNFYQGGVKSGCGFASATAGPFYCPASSALYLDTSFFDELANRFGARGDAAQAYVVAHEVGHHIQHLTGAAQQVSRIQQSGSSAEGNAASVRLELQADCYAGVWAKQSGRLEPGDIEEGLTAAAAIGDDTLQRQSGSAPVPDSFTHGTSEQRQRWLRRGLESGDPAVCDTFSGAI